MRRRGGLQLGLNAIVSFIISVMIFGFGIYLVGVFMDKGIIDPPDFCASELQSKLRQNEVFAVCPTTITLSEGEMRRGFRIAYAYYNVDSNPRELFFHIYNEGGSIFQKQESPIIIPPNSAGQGIAIVGLKDDKNALQINYISLLLCEEREPTNYDDTEGCISQQKIINIHKR